MLGGIIGGIGSAITGAIGLNQQKKTNEENRAREDKVRSDTWNREDKIRSDTWSREDKIRYETQNREDNAIQRRARDLELAGINPLLAAGDPAQASGQATSGGTTSGGAVGQDQAGDYSQLQGALSGTGQWADQMAYQKKMQILQENKQDAEIEKIEAEAESIRKDTEGADDRNEQTRLQNEKIKREQEKVSAEIEAIKENTELTKEKQKSEIQSRLIESIIETGKIEGHAGIPGWIGAEREQREFEWLPDLIERIRKGETSPDEAQREAYEKAKKELEEEQKIEKSKEFTKNAQSFKKYR